MDFISGLFLFLSFPSFSVVLYAQQFPHNSDQISGGELKACPHCALKPALCVHFTSGLSQAGLRVG